MGRVWSVKYLEADELTFPAMERKYGVSARKIAEVNEVPWTTSAVTDWIIEAGGKQLPSGHAVFQVDNAILLPMKTAAQQNAENGANAGAMMAAQTQASTPSTKWLVAGMVGGLLLFGFQKAQKRRR